MLPSVGCAQSQCCLQSADRQTFTERAHPSEEEPGVQTLWLTCTEPLHYRAVCFLPIIPLSLLSRVELGLLMVSQGLLLAAVLLTQLFKVEQGLSVLGDAVLLVSVEHGLMPWLRAVHCKTNGRRKVSRAHTGRFHTCFCF